MEDGSLVLSEWKNWDDGTGRTVVIFLFPRYFLFLGLKMEYGLADPRPPKSAQKPKNYC